MENSSHKIPAHVAIIMDGNGRWAEERGLPRIRGHQKGVDAIRAVAKASRALGLKYLTLYAFSKENWARPKREVEFLMNLLSSYLDSELNELDRNQIRFNAIGRINDLPAKIQDRIHRNMEKTKHHTELMMTLALSYSSRVEITDAVKQLAREVQAGRLLPESIDEAVIERNLYTAGIPDPDLLIRTSGEQRISNFLLWQISYTEIYVSKKYWPDFTREDLERAIEAYGKRERRFGRTDAPSEIII